MPAPDPPRPRHRVYREYCEKINAIYERYTDRVERAGLDESYLDCTKYLGPFGGDSEKLARDILRRVTEETGLTVSIGVSWNKAFAKLGSDYKNQTLIPLLQGIITKTSFGPCRLRRCCLWAAQRRIPLYNMA